MREVPFTIDEQLNFTLTRLERLNSSIEDIKERLRLQDERLKLIERLLTNVE